MTASLFVFDGVLQSSMRTPDSPAIIFGDETLNYGEFAWRICRVASGVEAKSAQRVAASLPNHPALLEIFFGATLAGAVFVLLEPKWPQETLAAVLQGHAPQLFFGDEKAAHVNLRDYAAWRESQDPNRELSIRPTPQRPFMVGFTSGTTGVPKAFIRNHASWTNSFSASRIEFGITNKMHLLLPGPMSHGLSLYAAVETLNAGGSVTIEPTFDAQHMMHIAEAGHVNTIVAAPTLLDLMLAAAPGASISAITTIITAGAKLLPGLRTRLLRTFLNARVIEYYGASELSFVSVARTDEGCPPNSVGRAFNGVEIKIEKDAGEIGTVWVKSAMIAAGYVGPTDGVGLRIKDGWATVGDRGSLDANGFLTLIGREVDMIISGGLNVYPSEVEAVLSAVPGVSEVWVTGQSDDRWGEVVTAVVSSTAPASLDVAVLKKACIERLAPHKHPRRWFLIDKFVHTASGKIDRTDATAKLRAHTLKVLS